MHNIHYNAREHHHRVSGLKITLNWKTFYTRSPISCNQNKFHTSAIHSSPWKHKPSRYIKRAQIQDIKNEVLFQDLCEEVVYKTKGHRSITMCAKLFLHELESYIKLSLLDFSYCKYKFHFWFQHLSNFLTSKIKEKQTFIYFYCISYACIVI